MIFGKKSAKLPYCHNFDYNSIFVKRELRTSFFKPLRPNSDLSQTSHCNIKGLSVSEVMRIENLIPQAKFY